MLASSIHVCSLEQALNIQQLMVYEWMFEHYVWMLEHDVWIFLSSAGAGRPY
jgi:hypothetical protein